MKIFLFTKSDLKYTMRLLAKKPGFTLLSVIVLAGGLSVSIIAFTVCYTLFFKQLPITNGESIHRICAGPEQLACNQFRAFEFAQLRQNISTLENIGVYDEFIDYVDIRDSLVRTRIVTTEWNMFQLSQSSALLGRTLQPDDQQANAVPVAVLGYAYWQQHFNGSEGIIGETINVSEVPTRIVGVMPEGYLFPWASQLWLPASIELLAPLENGNRTVNVFGLLPDETPEASADAEIASLMNRTRQQYPSEFKDDYSSSSEYIAQLDSGYIASFVGSSSAGIAKLGIMIAIGVLTGFIFLLTCINVGTLLLARTNERLKDISIRVALGAPSKRLALQIMSESIAIAILGGLLAVLLVGVTLELLNLWLTSFSGARFSLPFWLQFHVDASTVAGAFLFVLCAVILTSAIPSWRLINGDFNAVMGDGTRGAVGLKPGRFSKMLVVTAITLITLLLYLGSATGSVTRSMLDLLPSMGFDNNLLAQPRLDAGRYSQAEKLQFYSSLAQALQSEAVINNIQIQQGLGQWQIETEDQASSNSENSVSRDLAAPAIAISAAVGTLIEGRTINNFDGSNSQPIATVSRSLAEQLWPGQSAIGQQLRNVSSESNAASWRTIVGVMSDVRMEAHVFSDVLHMIYVPLAQIELARPTVRVEVNTDLDPNFSRATIVLANAIEALDPSLAPVSVNDINEEIEVLTQSFGLGINILTGCGLFSFFIAMAGIFGLTQNSIRSATHEIGTRRALGATDSKISLAYILSSGKQVMWGFGIAMLIALPITYAAVSVAGFDIVRVTLLTISAVIAALYGTVMLAVHFPVRKILLLEPSEALRHE